MSVENGAVEVQEVVLKPDGRDMDVSPNATISLNPLDLSDRVYMSTSVLRVPLQSYAEAFVDGAS